MDGDHPAVEGSWRVHGHCIRSNIGNLWTGKSMYVRLGQMHKNENFQPIARLLGTECEEVQLVIGRLTIAQL